MNEFTGRFTLDHFHSMYDRLRVVLEFGWFYRIIFIKIPDSFFRSAQDECGFFIGGGFHVNPIFIGKDVVILL